MKRENMIEDLEMFLIELLEKERFEFLEPYMGAGEGCPANTLIGSPAKEILDFLENKGMLPPKVPCKRKDLNYETCLQEPLVSGGRIVSVNLYKTKWE